MLSVIKLNVIYAECHYVECHYAECRGAPLLTKKIEQFNYSIQRLATPVRVSRIQQ